MNENIGNVSEEPVTQEELGDAIEMLGSGYEEVRIKDESNDRKYFIITPRIVKAYSRNPFDLALWDTIKDIAGESGECYLNTDQLATLSGMSTGQVSKSRRYWMKLGFLKGEMRKDPGYSQKVWHLSVPDIWKINVEWCEKYPKIEDRLAFRKAHRSLHLVKPSPGEDLPSPGETKKRYLKKNKNNDNDERAVSERTALFAKLYESNIGVITPLLADIIRNAAIDFTSSDWYEPAFRISVANNKRHINYVIAILQGWKENYFGWKPEFNGNGANRKGRNHANGKANNSTDPDQAERDAELGREILAERAARQPASV